jgi:hypothetical protein
MGDLMINPGIVDEKTGQRAPDNRNQTDTCGHCNQVILIPAWNLTSVPTCQSCGFVCRDCANAAGYDSAYCSKGIKMQIKRQMALASIGSERRGQGITVKNPV